MVFSGLSYTGPRQGAEVEGTSAYTGVEARISGAAKETQYHSPAERMLLWPCVQPMIPPCAPDEGTQDFKALACKVLTDFLMGNSIWMATQSAPGQDAKPKHFLHVQCSLVHAMQPRVCDAGTHVQCSLMCITPACKTHRDLPSTHFAKAKPWAAQHLLSVKLSPHSICSEPSALLWSITTVH